MPFPPHYLHPLFVLTLFPYCVFFLSFIPPALNELKSVLDSKKGRKLIIDGVPVRARRAAWGSLCSLHSTLVKYKDYYETCLQQLAQRPTKSQREIAKDVKRTMQHHPLFQTDDGLTRLGNVLGVFSFKNPIIGYCQSMNMLAAALLLFYPEEEAFWMLDHLISHITPTDYYSQNMTGVHADIRVLNGLVSKRLPELYRHFQQHGVDFSQMSYSWFLCLFVEVLPLESAVRVWDIVMVEQSLAVIFRVSLAILMMKQSLLLSLDNTSDLLAAYMTLPVDILDCDALLTLAHTKPCMLTPEELKKLREPVRKQLDKDLLQNTRFLSK